MDVLFIDDSLERYYEISTALMGTDATLDQARTANEALEYLAIHRYDYIFLDYDLGENAGSGKKVAKYIAKNIGKFEECTIIFHSANTVGSKYMIDEITKAIINVESFGNPMHLLLYYVPLKHADKSTLESIGLL